MSSFLVNAIPVRVHGVRIMVHERHQTNKDICIQKWNGRWRVFSRDGYFKTVTVDSLDDARLYAEAHA